MKIAVSTDEHTELVDYILSQLTSLGYETIYFGPTTGAEGGDETDWPVVTQQAVSQVVTGQADEAIVMCWTGTGASLAANKVAGIRAALVHDAETAAGARKWNHANVLALSLRATPLPIAKEILDAWFNTPFTDDDWNKKQMARIQMMESQFGSLS